jgi:hypothetical protein
MVGVCRSKQTQTGIESSADSSQQPSLMPVSSPAVIELTHLSKISQVPSSSAIVTVTMAMMVRSSSSSPGGRSPAQESLFWSPPMGVIPVCVWSRLSLTLFLLHLSSFLNSKCDFQMTGVIPRLLQSFVGQLCA